MNKKTVKTVHNPLFSSLNDSFDIFWANAGARAPQKLEPWSRSHQNEGGSASLDSVRPPYLCSFMDTLELVATVPHLFANRYRYFKYKTHNKLVTDLCHIYQYYYISNNHCGGSETTWSGSGSWILLYKFWKNITNPEHRDCLFMYSMLPTLYFTMALKIIC